MSQPRSTVDHSRRKLLLAGLAAVSTTPAVQDATLLAQESQSEAKLNDQSRLSYDSAQIQNWRIGLILQTPVACTDVLATFAVPMDWPEQKVTVRGDRSTAYANVVTVLDICKGAGIQEPYLDTVLTD
jgi:biopolymer transport protein ExbD